VNIAIYGGTFDPVHRGHLEAARAAAEEYALDRVLLVPAGHPPHRAHSPGAEFEHRFRMVEIAVQGDSRMIASRLEAPGNDGKRHYSIDTIQRLRSELAPGDRLFFVIGADAFAEIATWYRWREILDMVEFIVVSRPGEELAAEDVPAGATVHWLRNVNVPISSTEIRERLAQGQSADAWLDPAVAGYIRSQALYGRQTSGLKICGGGT
jgi:nicotinate-nucleotide adenylyltransferase